MHYPERAHFADLPPAIFILLRAPCLGPEALRQSAQAPIRWISNQTWAIPSLPHPLRPSSGYHRRNESHWRRIWGNGTDGWATGPTATEPPQRGGHKYAFACQSFEKDISGLGGWGGRGGRRLAAVCFLIWDNNESHLEHQSHAYGRFWRRRIRLLRQTRS